MAKTPTWQDILKSKDKFADTTEIKIGDTAFTLGDLRQFDAEQQGAVAKELQRATEMQKKLEQDQLTVAQLYTELSNQKPPAAQPQPQPQAQEIDYSSDPILRPLAQRLESQVNEVKSLKEQLTTELANVKKQVQTATASYINDSWQSGYKNFVDSSDDVVKPILSKVQLQDALRYASENNIVDRRQVPDPVQAALRMTESDRLEAIRKAEHERGKQEGIELGRKQAIADSPRPGVLGRKTIQPPHKTMDEAIAALGNDPEIQEQLSGISRVQ